mmetsp:Transcript_102496/g.289485  ORF Transcript_102496/g.289485 Transcript_102496/m.289485 type:complete len:223 (-) Transcript_102496:880-1548(-)
MAPRRTRTRMATWASTPTLTTETTSWTRRNWPHTSCWRPPRSQTTFRCSRASLRRARPKRQRQRQRRRPRLWRRCFGRSGRAPLWRTRNSAASMRSSPAIVEASSRRKGATALVWGRKPCLGRCRPATPHLRLRRHPLHRLVRATPRRRQYRRLKPCRRATLRPQLPSAPMRHGRLNKVLPPMPATRKRPSAMQVQKAKKWSGRAPGRASSPMVLRMAAPSR